MIPALRNFKLVIEYDGTAYHGWQRQKADITIQSTIEGALKRMTGKCVSLIGSGVPEVAHPEAPARSVCSV